MINFPPCSVTSESLWNYEGYGIIASKSTIAFFDALKSIEITDYPTSMLDLNLPISDAFKCLIDTLPIMRYDQDSLLKLLFGMVQLALAYGSPTFDADMFHFAIYLLLMRTKILVCYHHCLDVLNLEKYRKVSENEAEEVFATTNMLFLTHVESLFRDLFEGVLMSQERICSGPEVALEPPNTLEIPLKTIETNFTNFKISNGIRRCYFTEFCVVKQVTPAQYATYVNVLIRNLPESLRDPKSSDYLNAKYSEYLDMSEIYYCGFRKVWIYKPEMFSFNSLLSLYIFLSTK